MTRDEVFESTLEILEFLAEDAEDEAVLILEEYDEAELRQMFLGLANAYLNRVTRTITAQEFVQSAYEVALAIYGGPDSSVALAIATIDNVLNEIL